ncbi:MAG: serine hydrolase [Desulfamplus sp.]|nr:serine hydrolase [Desulfamplus sp.]
MAKQIYPCVLQQWLKSMLVNNKMKSISQLMQDGVNDGVFPSGVLLISHKDKIIFHEAFGVANIEARQLVQKDSIFDLASLTKPLATALCVMKLVEQGILCLEQRLSQIQHIVQTLPNYAKPLPSPPHRGGSNVISSPHMVGSDIIPPLHMGRGQGGGANYCVTSINNDAEFAIPKDKADITLDQLLRHTSGLPAHRPFYQELILHPEPERKKLLRELILKEPLVQKPGKEQIYSDLGYMLLAWIVERVSGFSLDIFAYKFIYEPIGINNLFFIPIHQNSCSDKSYSKNINCKNNNDLNKYIKKQIADLKQHKLFVPTEICPWRKKMLQAEVHDDNAWAVGGVEGHAGLFGTALGVWSILIELMKILHGDESLLVRSDILKIFLAKKSRVEITYNHHMFESIISKRFDMVAGFDTPSVKGSSSGRYFASESIGHLGFTGTSFWLDPIKSLIVILLSNRVHPTRTNQKIKEFRPKLHDLIMETLGIT